MEEKIKQDDCKKKTGGRLSGQLVITSISKKLWWHSGLFMAPLKSLYGILRA